MGEVAGVEVEAQFALLAPVDPVLELGGGVFVALNFLAIEIGVERVQIKPVFAGDQRKSFVEILPELNIGAGFAGVVAGRLDAAAKRPIGIFRSRHVVALPAMEGNRDGLQFLEDGFGVDAELCIGFLGEGIGWGAHGGSGMGLGSVCGDAFEIGANADDDCGENECCDA